MTLLYLISINIISCKCSLILVRFYVFSKTNAGRHVYMYICHTSYFSWIANQNDNITSAPPTKNFWLRPWLWATQATLCFKIATLISYGRASTIPKIRCCLHKIWILEGCFLLDNQRHTYLKEGSNYDWFVMEILCSIP